MTRDSTHTWKVDEFRHDSHLKGQSLETLLEFESFRLATSLILGTSLACALVTPKKIYSALCGIRFNTFEVIKKSSDSCPKLCIEIRTGICKNAVVIVSWPYPV